MIDQYLNKIIHADCLEFMKQLPDKCIDLVLTDPPYGMNFISNYRQIKHLAIENDDNLDWLEEFVKQIRRLLKDQGHAYIFCSFHNIEVFKKALNPVKNILIWEKNNTGMGDLFGDYAPQYEMCLFISGGKKLNGNRDSNILKYNKTNNELHPTEKPVSLFEYLVSKSTEAGDTVLDCFAGSCTTAVACANLKRNYICIEKEESYVKICHERIDAMTQSMF